MYRNKFFSAFDLSKIALILIESQKRNQQQNSKVFEQKGDLLNFKANIDPRAMLSRVKPG